MNGQGRNAAVRGRRFAAGLLRSGALMRSTAGHVRKLSMFAATGVVLLVASGCSGTDPVDPAPGTTSVSTSTSPPPMTVAEYQAVLTGVEQAIRPVFDRFVAAATLDDANAARLSLVATFDAQRKAVDRVEPPAKAAEPHRQVLNALSVGTDVRNYVPKSPPPNSCGAVAASVETQLYEVKRDVYSSIKSGTTAAVLGLADLHLTFGALMFPPEPVAPPVSSRRARNGEVVQRAGPRGRGRLVIKNGTGADVAVSAVTGDPSAPQATIYVHGGANATLTGLSGKYSVYFKSGADWDAGRRGFTRDCSFEKFDEPFDDRAWEIQLEKTIGGNARSSTVPPF